MTHKERSELFIIIYMYMHVQVYIIIWEPAERIFCLLQYSYSILMEFDL